MARGRVPVLRDFPSLPYHNHPLHVHDALGATVDFSAGDAGYRGEDFRLQVGVADMPRLAEGVGEGPAEFAQAEAVLGVGPVLYFYRRQRLPLVAGDVGGFGAAPESPGDAAEDIRGNGVQ